MEAPSVVHSTFVIEKSFPQTPERVFAAFADPAKKRRWFFEGESHDLEMHELDFREGGSERAEMRFREGTPFPGVAMTNQSRYVDIVPDRRIVSAYTMQLGGRRITASLVTIELLRTDAGTDLICTHQGAYFEGADGPEMRQEGWRTLLGRLEKELAG